MALCNTFPTCMVPLDDSMFFGMRPVRKEIAESTKEFRQFFSSVLCAVRTIGMMLNTIWRKQLRNTCGITGRRHARIDCVYIVSEVLICVLPVSWFQYANQARANYTHDCSGLQSSHRLHKLLLLIIVEHKKYCLADGKSRPRYGI